VSTTIGVEVPTRPAPSVEAQLFGKPPSGWRRTAFEIIFESQTRAGRTFDLVLLTVIVASVLVVILDSVSTYAARYGDLLDPLEWTFTALFTLEYLARITSVQRPWRYATSFFGIVDLMSVLPTYLAFFFPELHALIDIRLLRLLRVFRILKLTEYLTEISVLGDALRASRRKILVFICTVLTIDVLMGTLLYVVEGPKNGFTNIPVSVYWAITTMTTVGFGDITPQTGLGRTIASFMMLLGWGILAVPTGIVTAEMTHRRFGTRAVGLVCDACGADDHAASAKFCAHCGKPLPAMA
jgi:voltage-gated potassium channel